MEPKKLLLFVSLALVCVVVAWMIFAPQPERYENEGGATTTAVGNVYSNETFGFDVTVPPSLAVDESYLNQDLGPGKEIPGVAFRIPASLSQGTNLSPDSYAAVEELSDVACAPADFLLSPGPSTEETVGSYDFTVASSSDAAAGNRYDETVYILPKGDRCYAVRYFIHSTNVGNYEPGTVTPFDRAAVVGLFDQILSSLRIH